MATEPAKPQARMDATGPQEVRRADRFANPDFIRRSLPKVDWQRMHRALLLHAADCEKFANELQARCGMIPAVNMLRDEAVASRVLAADLDVERV